MSRAQFDTSDVKRKCETKLAIEFREGKEYNGWFVHDGRKICRITVPMGRKEIRPGTYSSMARQLNLTAAKLDDLLECPLDLAGYLQELRTRRILE